MWNPYDFTGKRIVITGATAGIGRSTALKLSQQGAEVCFIARDKQRAEDLLDSLEGHNHKYYIKDLAVDNNFKDIFDDIVKDGHKIDGLVHCAGIAKILPVSHISKMSMEESMSIGVYAFAEMIGLLSKRKYHEKASVVGISSISVKYPQKCQGVYVASKAAMNGLIESLAIELADKNIRINSVLPGVTNTRMQIEANDMDSDQIRSSIPNQLLGLIEPEDIANIVLFLLSDASSVITGRTICADGGTIPDLTIHNS